MSDGVGVGPRAEFIELLADPLEHLDQLIALRVRWAQEAGREIRPDDPFLDDFRAWLTQEAVHRRFWIVLVNNSPVAMVNLLVFDRMPTVGIPSGGWGYLCNMYVEAAHRDRGLGARLASSLLEHADQLGLERVVLSPSERSRPFYGSLGFDPASNLLLRPRPTSQESQDKGA